MTKLEELKITELKPAEDNPRTELGDIDGLAQSIQEHGLIEPLVVVPNCEGYIVAAGHRRLAALKQIGAEVANCIVKDMTEQERQATMIIENIQREDIDPHSEGLLLVELKKTNKLTQAQLAKMVGKSQPYVSKRLKLGRVSLSIYDECKLDLSLEEIGELSDITLRRKFRTKRTDGWNVPSALRWAKQEVKLQNKLKDVRSKFTEISYSDTYDLKRCEIEDATHFCLVNTSIVYYREFTEEDRLIREQEKEMKEVHEKQYEEERIELKAKLDEIEKNQRTAIEDYVRSNPKKGLFELIKLEFYVEFDSLQPKNQTEALTLLGWQLFSYHNDVSGFWLKSKPYIAWGDDYVAQFEFLKSIGYQPSELEIQGYKDEGGE